MTEPPAEDSAGDAPRHRDVFAPAPRPRPHHAAPPTPDYLAAPPPAYPTLPAPGSYDEQAVPPYSPLPYPAPYAAHYPAPSPMQYPAPAGYAPYGYPEPPPATDLPPRHRWPWVALVVVIAAAATAVWLVVSPSKSSPKKVALPASFAGYTRLDNAAAQSVQSMINGMASGNSVMRYAFSHASVGVYAKDTGDTPAALTVLFPASFLASAPNSSATDMTTTIEHLAPNARDLAPGSNGGSLTCGQATFGPAVETICGWEDSKTGGMFFSVRPPISITDAAAATNALRDAVDH